MSGEDVFEELIRPELCLSRAKPNRDTLRDESSSWVGEEALAVGEANELGSEVSPKGLKEPTYPDDDRSIIGGLPEVKCEDKPGGPPNDDAVPARVVSLENGSNVPPPDRLTPATRSESCASK